jgi:hypothetical protein
MYCKSMREHWGGAIAHPRQAPSDGLLWGAHYDETHPNASLCGRTIPRQSHAG